MSVIQSIREKYAKWAVVAIALALLGFILTDYLSAKNRMFGGGNSTTIGSVNGKKIDYTDFESKLRSFDDQAQQQGRSLSETDRHTNMERLWNQEVEQIILNSQFDKLGLVIGKKELNDWFFGTNPPADLKQRFTDPATGMYNPSQVQETINQIKRSGTQAEKDQLNLYLASLEYSRQLEKFNSLFSNSVYYPKWYVEKQNAENSGLAKIAYVSYPYAKIADSTVKVSDKEIEEYISKNKDQFKQEESRSIAVVVFDAAPTASDSAAVKKQVSDMKADFAAAPDPAVFLARYGSTLEYFDGYSGKSQIQVPAKDSVLALAKNQVYGAYLDASSYVLAKMIDSRSMPDSVKVRHILVKTFEPQQGQQLLPDSVGKNRIDSIERAIKAGARFDSLAIKLSNDGSAANGGLLEVPLYENGPTSPYFVQGRMVKEFNDYCFEGKTGDMKVVKTIFGYHLIEILDQKNFQPHYKIAYFGKRIVATDETDAAALEAASKFASESRDLKSFDDNYEKIKAKGYQKFTATNIKPTDISISSLNAYGTSRQLVRDIYKADRGDVLPQQRIGDKYIVAVLTEVFEEGTMSVASARPLAEPVLNKKKKAEQVKQMLGNFSTLDAAAVIFKDSIKVIDSLRISGGANLGYEPKILGAAFNVASKGKLINEPLAGLQAVYVVRVDDQTTTSVSVFGIEEQKAQLRQRAQQMQNFYSNPVTLLRKLASIKDNRSNFY